MIPKLSRIKRTSFFIIWAICQQIIQFRLAFKDKGHKSLEYCCQLFSNTFDIRRYNFSSVSTISYAESNGGIFILIAPLIRQYKYKDKRTASDLSTIQFRLIFKGHKSLEYWCLVNTWHP
jgi:hypothetical protein